MNSHQGQNASGSFYLESTATSQFLPKILDEALKNEAHRVELSLHGEKTLSLIFHTKDKKFTREFACTPAFWKGILSSIDLKAVSLPVTPSQKQNEGLREKILSLQLRPKTALECIVEKHKGMKSAQPTIVFRELQPVNNLPSRFEQHQSEYNKQTLELVQKAQKGIILCNYAPSQANGRDGLRYCYSLRSDARICHSPATDQDLRKILELADNSLVLLGIESTDVVESILETGNLFREEKESIRRFYSLILTSVAAHSVRMTCKKCAKRTTISKDFVASLPPALQPGESFEYMVGRGCDVCQHTAYQDWIDLLSTLQITPELHTLLERGASAAQITELASRAGARSLLEDGIEKVSHRITTFEEVLSAIKRISSGFLAAVIHRTGRNDLENPLEEALRLQLEEIDSEYFFKDGKASHKQKILLVEDNKDQLDILAMVLEKEGYQILTAQNGKEALNILEENTTQLVVCDLMMPVMNGEDFVRALRDSEKGAHLPVLMLTAINDEDTEYNLLSAGADDYCSKGTKKKLILKRIERLIHRTNNPLP